MYVLAIGSPTPYVDWGLVAINLFVLFFAALIVYLHRESKREGYPLVDDNGRVVSDGLFGIPAAKTYKLADGTSMDAPRANGADNRPVKGRQMALGIGSPYEPTGANPLLDSIGPSSYAERRDIPDVTYEGKPRIVPMRVATDFSVLTGDLDPRGMTVVGADGAVGGKVTDVWVDRSEFVIRYLEVAVGAPGTHVLLPMNMADVQRSQNRIMVHAVLGKHFADVPKLKAADRVTLLEEEKVMGYFGGGYLYATPDRQEALL